MKYVSGNVKETKLIGIELGGGGREGEIKKFPMTFLPQKVRGSSSRDITNKNQNEL